MSEILSNTGVKLWSETDYNELWLTIFDQLTGQGGKSNIRLIDEAIGKINAALDGYKFEFSSDEDRLYISKGDSKLPVSLIDSNGHVATKVDGTTITIDESGVIKGVPVDDALSEESTNPLQNKVIAGELKSIKSKMGTDESAIKQNTSDITSNTKRIEANETAISTLNGTGDGSVKKAVSDGIAKVVAGAPEDFDTLKEMSDWISGHENDASAMNSAIKDNKNAITTLQTDKADKTEIPTVPTNVSEFTNDAGYLTEHQDISNLVVKEEGKGLSSNDYTNEEKTKLGGVGTPQGRNLIPCPSTDKTTNGITYTVQSDGSVVANGTASAENNAYYNFAYKTLKLGDTSYTLSCEGLPKSVYVYVYDETISKAVANVSDTSVTKTFVGDSTHTYSLSINVGKGTPVSDLAIKPILEMGTIAHAYEPISESNVNLKDAIDKISTSQGKNLISYPYYNGTSFESNGVTYTVNEVDGTITVNGTATKESDFRLVSPYDTSDRKTLELGQTYTLSDGVNQSNSIGYQAPIYFQFVRIDATKNDFNYGISTNYGNMTWTASDANLLQYGIRIVVRSGVTIDNVVLKPMLEIGAIAHMYEPTTISNTTLRKKVDSFKQYEPDGTTITADKDGTLHGVSKIDVDDALSDESTNPVQNKAVNKAIDELKKSVSDGKTKVANAITDKGVKTATDATFDVMAKNISKIDTELHGATLAVSTSDNELFGKTVTLTLNGANVGTTVFASNGKCSFVVQNPGTYTITCGEAHKDATVTSDNVLNKTVISVNLSLLKIVTFADGTDEEIAKMIQAHYNYKIKISDYWAVGDTRTVSLSAMEATGVGESHRAQSVQFVIGDFDHDDLVAPIQGHTKAAVTLLQKDCLMDATSASNSSNGSSDTERGYMHNSSTNTCGWMNCARRTWCNNVYFKALPTAWQSMIKTVKKQASIGDRSAAICTVKDKIFLAAECEIFGVVNNLKSASGEGTQYKYYKTSANRYKNPRYKSNYVTQNYWERSPCKENTYTFCCTSNASMGSYDANNENGLAPCMCI